MKKIYWGGIVLIILLVGGYFVFIQKPKETNPNLIPIKIGYDPTSITSASIMIAYEKDYFKKHNLSPQMVPLQSGSDVMKALASGQINFGMAGFSNFIQAMAKGTPLRQIAPSSSAPSLVFIRPNEKLNNFTDLYGKTISVSVSGMNNLIFREVMNQENIDATKMKFTYIDKPYLVSALIDKKAIDAVVVQKTDAEMLIKAGAIVLPEWDSKGYSKQNAPRDAIIVNSEFLNKQEPAVERFLDALIDSHRFIHNSPTEAATLVAKHIKDLSDGAIVHSPEEIVKQWNNKEITNMIWQNPSITLDLAKKAKEVGIIDKELTIGDIYDLRFQSKLETAQKEIYGNTN